MSAGLGDAAAAPPGPQGVRVALVKFSDPSHASREISKPEIKSREMLTMPETRRTEATLSNLLFHAYRRRVADFEECLAKFGAEGSFNLNALNDVAWRTSTHEGGDDPQDDGHLNGHPVHHDPSLDRQTEETLLMTAVRGGSAEIVKILLDRGADPDLCAKSCD